MDPGTKAEIRRKEMKKFIQMQKQQMSSAKESQ